MERIFSCTIAIFLIFGLVLTVGSIRAVGQYALGIQEEQGACMPTEETIAETAESLPPEVEWNKTYGRIYREQLWSLIQTSDGGYALGGDTESSPDYYCGFWLVKTDSEGEMQWNKKYGGTDESDQCMSVIQTSEAGYILAGSTSSFDMGDARLIWTDSVGNVMWSKTYGGEGCELAYVIIQSTDGGYVFAGSTNSYGNGGMDFWLVKIDANGNLQWNKTYGGNRYEEFPSLIETSDGGYALAGRTNSYGAGDHDFYFVKTDDQGNMQWNKTYGGIEHEGANSLVQTIDGGYALAGYSESFDTSGDVWFVKTDSEGNVEWDRIYTEASHGSAHDCILTSDGGYALACAIKPNATSKYDACLVKIDASGDVSWNITYGWNDSDYARCVLETAVGGYALGCMTNSTGAGDYDFWLIKLGMPYDVTIDAFCLYEGMNVNVEILMDGFSTGYTTPHTFTDIVGTHTFTVSDTDSAGHLFKQWNTGDVTQAKAVNAAGTYTAYYELRFHNIALVHIDSKSVIGQGYTVLVKVKIENQGNYTEAFTATLYAQSFTIQTKYLVLQSNSSAIVQFSWDTSGYAIGDYIVKVNASIVLDEIDIEDNTIIGDWVTITIPGDDSGDYWVKLADLVALANSYGSRPEENNWNPNADIDCNNSVGLSDLVILTQHYGQHY
jgi:hypothetical protein